MDNLEVIYVEDDEQEAFIMTVGMRRQGIRIVHVPDINLDSVAQLQQPPIAHATAIIFDALLAGESGVELARKLRNLGDQRLIFLLTAAENPDPVLLRALNIRYMRKPPDYAVLARAIREAQPD